MKISEVSVKRPVCAAVISLMLVILGLLSASRLAVGELPDVEAPIVSIDTNYLGASADVVETKITQVIEERVAGLEGITKITSQSTDGRSSINIEFDPGRSVDEAANDVRDRVARVVGNLPPEADPPEVGKVDFGAEPVIWLALSSDTMNVLLFWGILGALVMRAFFIATGIALIHMFHWVMYVFGAFLIIIAVKMAFEKEKEIHPEKNPVLRLFRRFIPVTEDYVAGKFFIRKNKKSFATPLFVVLLVIETPDVIFAVDSIPAILAITTDPFIVYTSNVFAILGLRALYFALAGAMALFHFLNKGLAIILAFVGVKMLLSKFYEIPVGVALGVVILTLVITIVASIIFPKSRQNK